MCIRDSGLGERLANPLLNLTGENEALAHQPKQFVDHVGGDSQRGLGRRRGGRLRLLGLRCFGLGGRRQPFGCGRQDFVAGGDTEPVDAVRPIQHFLQHVEGLRGRSADAQQGFGHDFQTVGGVQQSAGQGPIGERAMFGERLQNVFDVMGEGGDAAHADGVALSLIHI